MKHHNQNRKLGRVRKQRRALLNSLARSLILKKKIKTTEPKAKELRPFVEKLVTMGKKNDAAARRLASEKLDRIAVKALFDNVAKKYIDRKGGYTRITKSGRRLSDGSRMAIIEFV
jgi:large subunit ribosomal protein L17